MFLFERGACGGQVVVWLLICLEKICDLDLFSGKGACGGDVGFTFTYYGVFKFDRFKFSAETFYFFSDFLN